MAIFTEWAGKADSAYDVLWEQYPNAETRAAMTEADVILAARRATT